MAQDPGNKNTTPDQLPAPVQQEINRLLALGYPPDMLHVSEDGKVIIYKMDELEGIEEMWAEINKKP